MTNLAAALDDRLRALETELEQLAADRKRQAELFAFAPEAQLVTDSSNIIQELNAAAHALLRAEGDLRGQPLDSLVPLEQRRGFAAFVSVARDGSGHARFAGSLRLRGGDLPVLFSVRVLRGAPQRLVWLVMPCHDALRCGNI